MEYPNLVWRWWDLHHFVQRLVEVGTLWLELFDLLQGRMIFYIVPTILVEWRMTVIVPVHLLTESNLQICWLRILQGQNEVWMCRNFRFPVFWEWIDYWSGQIEISLCWLCWGRCRREWCSGEMCPHQTGQICRSTLKNRLTVRVETVIE